MNKLQAGTMQDEKDWQPRSLGIGLRFLEFGIADAVVIDEDAVTISSFSTYLSGAIFIPFTLHTNFRMEPILGYTSSNDKTSNDDNEYSVVSFSSIGTGIFPMYQKGKTNIYTGIRLVFFTFKETEYDLVLTTKVKSVFKSSTFVIGPSVGGEYFPVRHFSIGAEADIFH